MNRTVGEWLNAIQQQPSPEAAPATDGTPIIITEEDRTTAPIDSVEKLFELTQAKLAEWRPDEGLTGEANRTLAKIFTPNSLIGAFITYHDIMPNSIPLSDALTNQFITTLNDVEDVAMKIHLLSRTIDGLLNNDAFLPTLKKVSDGFGGLMKIIEDRFSPTASTNAYLVALSKIRMLAKASSGGETSIETLDYLHEVLDPLEVRYYDDLLSQLDDSVIYGSDRERLQPARAKLKQWRSEAEDLLTKS